MLTLLAASCGAVSVSFGPDPQTLAPTQDLTAVLNLDTATLVHGYNLSIRYDPGILTFVSATHGSLFDGQSIFWWDVITDTVNVVNVACIITGQGYATGPGELLDLTFTANTGGLTQLEVDWIKIYDLSGGYVAGIDSSPLDVMIGDMPAYARIKCWLQGPYFQEAMQTALNQYIPLDSPYPEAPASVGDIPPDVVDWVLMELRATPSGAPLLSKSLWLGTDGYLRSPGISIVALPETPPGPYYVVLRHRNHLALMSLAAFGFSASGPPAELDLTDPANVYGQGGSALVEPGVAALIAGDADANGAVGPSDRNSHWRIQSGSSGYLSADFNLNGTVSPSDLNEFWRQNAGLATSVPFYQ